MAFLTIVEGGAPGRILQLHEGRTVLGRHPQCQIILENAAVSRYHAQILESHGSFFVEDLRSRNRTLLNGEPIDGRVELHDADEIQVCDVRLRFHLQQGAESPKPPPASVRISASDGASQGRRRSAGTTTRTADEVDQLFEGVGGGGSSIVSRVGTDSSQLRLDVRPEAKLRAVLEIGRHLGRVLDLEDVLQTTLDRLFQIFPQADDGFVVLVEPDGEKLSVKALKSRMPEGDLEVRVSKTIIQQALDSGEAILSADAAEDSRFDSSHSVSNLRIRSMMCVPLIGNSGTPLGAIQLDSKGLSRQFLDDDLEMLASVASQISLAVENAHMHQELLQQRDMQRDLEFATQVQLGFLPSQRPRIAGYELCDYYEAALRVGGDCFDYVPLPDGRLAITLGDVAGKGVPAALLMARLYSASRYQLLLTDTAAAALAGLNGEIASGGLGHRFVTYVVAVLDPRRHVVTIANAGHLPPLTRSKAGKVKSIGKKDSGMPLGIVPDQTFKEIELKIAPGDTLLLYTDGITEAMNSRHEIYGRQGLEKYLAGARGDVERTVQELVEDVERFSESQTQRDDVCLVAIRRLPDA
ncbi:MAG: SpoIIE family protein phosphatase [Planctomycetaceae bacterium]